MSQQPGNTFALCQSFETLTNWCDIQLTNFSTAILSGLTAILCIPIVDQLAGIYSVGHSSTGRKMHKQVSAEILTLTYMFFHKQSQPPPLQSLWTAHWPPALQLLVSVSFVKSNLRTERFYESAFNATVWSQSLRAAKDTFKFRKNATLLGHDRCMCVHLNVWI